MKKLRINVSLLLAILLVVLLAMLSFLGVYIIQQKESKTEDSSRVLVFEIGVGNKTQTVASWYNEIDGNSYVFIPADASTITLKNIDGYTVEAEGVSQGRTYTVDQLKLEQTYPYQLKKNGKEVKKGNILFMKSGNIPSLFIETNSGSMEYIHAIKGNKEKAKYTLLSSVSEECATGTILEMEGRGNTSWTDLDKKGYKLLFDKTQSLLGLKPSETYLLIANGRSNYLSNTIAFWLSEQMGIPYVPSCRHIDLYLNGEYVGNYILCEKIAVSATSIDITNLDEVNAALNPGQKVEDLVQYQSKDGFSKGVLWANEPENVTGGYFLERDVAEYYQDETSGFVLNSGDHYVIKGPKYAGQREVAYIQQYMQEMYDAVASEDGYHPTTKLRYTDYLDINSFAMKYALEEFLNFNDAGRSSAYYYKDVNGKLYAGPGWDFEGAFLGNSKYMTKLNGTTYSTDLYEKLWDHQDFQEAVKKNYQELLLPALQTLKTSKLEELKTQNLQSAKMDMVRWNREDFTENCKSIENWIAERETFLNDHWLSGKNYISVIFKSEWQNSAYIYLNEGETLDEGMLPNYIRDGFTFGGWADASSGELYDFEKVVEADLVLEAVWIPKNNSLIASVYSKFKQVIPELLFMAAFGCVAIIFIVKYVKKEKKK